MRSIADHSPSRGPRVEARGVVWLAIVTAVGTLGALSNTDASPLIDPRIGGLALVGPASPHPASMLHNPAVLGLLPGTHLLFDSTARIDSGTIERAPIDRSTGQPSTSPDAVTFGESSFSGALPQLFLAAASDLDSDSLVLGLSLYRTAESISLLQQPDGQIFDGASQGPNRYHGTDIAFTHYFMTLGAAIRLAEGWHLGVAFTYLHGNVDFGFVRDLALEGGSRLDAGEIAALDADCGDGPCNYENDGAAEAVRVSGNTDAFSFGAGLVGRLHERLEFGIGYSSAAVGLGGTGIRAGGDAWVRRATITAETQDLQGRGGVSYQLPHIISGGVTWQTTKRITLDLQLRWQLYQNNDQLEVRLAGAAFRDRQSQLPDRIVHYRGAQDAFAAQIGTAVQLTSRLQLQAAAMAISGSVRGDAVTAMTIDGWKADAFVALRWTLFAQLMVHAGYGFALMPPLTVDNSVFQPSAMVACVDSGFDVQRQECRAAAQGQGLASSNGRYMLVTHRIGAGVSYHWD